MEVLQSIAWITLGFLPMLGSMELAWRLYEKRRSKKTMIKNVAGMSCHKSSIEALQQLLHLGHQIEKLVTKSKKCNRLSNHQNIK
jgi:hypothetical protein